MSTTPSKFAYCFSILFFLTSSFFVLADKFVPATVVYKNGTEVDGFVHATIKNTQVKFRLTEKSKTAILDSKDLDLIVFYAAERSIKIKYTEIEVVKLSGEYKKAKKPLWLYVIETCDEIDIYEFFGGLDVSRTKVFLIHPDPMVNSIFIKRKGEERAKLVARAISSIKPNTVSAYLVTKSNKKLLSQYFKNNSKALNIIESDKEVTLNSLREIFDLVCQSAQ